MNLLKQLWKDEDGVILSAETVLIGTVGVIGLTTGLSALSNSVNEELKEVGSAIRSLDQSYITSGNYSCHASTPGSSFQQTPVETSLAGLRSSNCCQPAVILPDEAISGEEEPSAEVDDTAEAEEKSKRSDKKKKRSKDKASKPDELREL